jgi:N-acetylneuraminic acid mutarotase
MSRLPVLVFSAFVLALCAIAGVEAITPWSKLADLPSTRMEVAGGYIGTNIYVMGGYKSVQKDVGTDVFKYDALTNTWTTLAVQMPVGLHHAASARHPSNGKLYIAGGFSAPVNAVATLYSFDGAAFVTLASMTTKRGAATAQWIGDDKLYVAGGAEVYNVAPTLGALEVYTLSTNTWETKAAMNHAREHVASAIMNGRMYTFLGRETTGTGTDRELKYAEYYDPTANTWTDVTSVPTGRSGAGVAVVGGKAFLFGGEGNSGNVFNNVQTYDPSADSWTCYTPMVTARHGVVTLTLNDQILIFAGGLEGGSNLIGAVNDRFDTTLLSGNNVTCTSTITSGSYSSTTGGSGITTTGGSTGESTSSTGTVGNDSASTRSISVACLGLMAAAAAFVAVL